MGIEAVVQHPQSLQLKVFSEHDRPSHQAEEREPQDDDLVDRAATFENLDDIGGSEEW
jgi:hypothetical protein